MTQPYSISTIAHPLGLYAHTLRLYKVELDLVVTPFVTPPDDMVARMNRGNVPVTHKKVEPVRPRAAT